MNSIRYLVFFAAIVGATLAQTPPAAVCEKDCYHPMQLNTDTCTCFCTYQPSVDRNKYEIVIPGYPRPIPMFCPISLVWSQEECRCANDVNAVSPVGKDIIAPVKCETLTDLKSNGTHFANSANYYHKIEKSGDILLEDVVDAVDGKAANFQGTSLYIPVFEYNDLTSTAMINLRVNPVDGPHIYNSNTQVILSDACAESEIPAIELTYSPEQGNFTLKVTTSAANEEMCEGVPASASGWFNIDISILNGSPSWSINGVSCPQLTGSGNIEKTRCGLTIGGNPLSTNDSEDFYGHIDYVKIVKHCDTDGIVV